MLKTKPCPPPAQIMLRLEAARPGLPAVARGALLMSMVAVAIQVSVPLTFGMFKQTASVPASWLEKEIAQRAGGPDAKVIYNKGL